MISPAAFFELLKEQQIEFFAGVPDSLLKDFCAYLTSHTDARQHVIAANEGGAVALAAGWHLATGTVPLVYLQNSGLGNMVNPLTSLTDPEVYSIPMLLMIGWRGEPGVPDEPQHRKQGRITPQTLEALEIPYRILPHGIEEARQVVDEACAITRAKQMPFALLVRKGTFESYRLPASAEVAGITLSREEAVQRVLDALPANAAIVSTTGMISREVFEYREKTEAGHERDFLTVGSMGHASQIALGIALAKPEVPVYCLDGDGAVLMHMGALAISGTSGLKNYKHVILNNGAHDSVGGQPTVAFKVGITDLARTCGYHWVKHLDSTRSIEQQLEEFQQAAGPALLEIRVKRGARADLGRPHVAPVANKELFMKHLRQLPD